MRSRDWPNSFSLPSPHLGTGLYSNVKAVRNMRVGSPIEGPNRAIHHVDASEGLEMLEDSICGLRITEKELQTEAAEFGALLKDTTNRFAALSEMIESPSKRVLSVSRFYR